MHESRVWIFFLDPGKRISRLPRIETSDRPTIGLLWAGNCHLSLCTCYQLITCLLHRGHGPHTRRTDATKQRTVAYLSGRGQWQQMLLPPGADNCSYATASARQCKCSPFSLPLWETRKSTEMSADRPAASNIRPGVSRTRHLGASRRSHPPIAFYVCVLTGTLETRLLPTILRVHPRRHRLIVQWHLTWVGGNSLARHPGPIDHRASPVALAL